MHTASFDLKIRNKNQTIRGAMTRRRRRRRRKKQRHPQKSYQNR
jgi:hypothetical protein